MLLIQNCSISYPLELFYEGHYSIDLQFDNIDFHFDMYKIYKLKSVFRLSSTISKQNHSPLS